MNDEKSPTGLKTLKTKLPKINTSKYLLDTTLGGSAGEWGGGGCVVLLLDICRQDVCNKRVANYRELK